MTPEEFKRTYMDPHMELKVADVLEKGSFERSNSITRHPGDKGITANGPIPGKKLIESQAMDKRRKTVEHMVYDAISVKASETLDISQKDLISLAIKMAPQHVEQKIEGNLTLVHLVKSFEEEEIETIDVESK